MKITLYGLKNCDNCRKALKWFEARKLNVGFADIRAATPPQTKIKQWHAAYGDALLNRRGTSWRQLSGADKSKAENASGLIPLLHANPVLIKRPVVEFDSGVLVGFDETAFKKHFG